MDNTSDERGHLLEIEASDFKTNSTSTSTSSRPGGIPDFSSGPSVGVSSSSSSSSSSTTTHSRSRALSASDKFYNAVYAAYEETIKRQDDDGIVSAFKKLEKRLRSTAPNSIRSLWAQLSKRDKKALCDDIGALASGFRSEVVRWKKPQNSQDIISSGIKQHAEYFLVNMRDYREEDIWNKVYDSDARSDVMLFIVKLPKPTQVSFISEVLGVLFCNHKDKLPMNSSDVIQSIANGVLAVAIKYELNHYGQESFLMRNLNILVCMILDVFKLDKVRQVIADCFALSESLSSSSAHHETAISLTGRDAMRDHNIIMGLIDCYCVGNGKHAQHFFNYLTLMPYHKKANKQYDFTGYLFAHLFLARRFYDGLNGATKDQEIGSAHLESAKMMNALRWFMQDEEKLSLPAETRTDILQMCLRSLEMQDLPDDNSATGNYWTTGAGLRAFLPFINKDRVSSAYLNTAYDTLREHLLGSTLYAERVDKIANISNMTSQTQNIISGGGKLGLAKLVNIMNLSVNGMVLFIFATTNLGCGLKLKSDERCGPSRTYFNLVMGAISLVSIVIHAVCMIAAHNLTSRKNAIDRDTTTVPRQIVIDCDDPTSASASNESTVTNNARLAKLSLTDDDPSSTPLLDQHPDVSCSATNAMINVGVFSRSNPSTAIMTSSSSSSSSSTTTQIIEPDDEDELYDEVELDDAEHGDQKSQSELRDTANNTAHKL